MPSQQHYLSSASPFFSGDLQFSAEGGFRKVETLKNNTNSNYAMRLDTISSTPCGIPVVTSTLENKLVHVDSQETKFLQNPQQKLNFSLQRQAVGAERALSQSLNPVPTSNHNAQLSWHQNDAISPHFENRLFSSSLSELLSQKLQLSSNNNFYGHSADTVASHSEEEQPFDESLEEIEAQTIGNLLPDDDDDLFSGIVDGIESSAQAGREDDFEDLDIFNSVGGMDLGDDTASVERRNSEFMANYNTQVIGANISYNGEHPYGEHPSRTLFVRNINSNVEDSELKALFEQYGDIRTLYTACKHRGFVMISYFDIRAARNAMKALQNKLLRRRRLDIHYSIPKDNPSDKDVNQGTLVAFNLDSSVSSGDLQQIFGAYGEVKEIRETPHRSNQKLIEFYDIRAADEALHALNESVIAEKTIKVELSHLGGARQSSTQPLAPGLEHEEPGLHIQQSSAGILCGSINSTSSKESDTVWGSGSGIQASMQRFMESPTYHGISSSVPSILPSLIRAESASSQAELPESGSSISHVKHKFRGLPTLYPRSLPDYHDGSANSISCNYDFNMPATVSYLPQERVENPHLGRKSSNVDLCNGFATSGNGSGSLPVHHYVWNNSNHPQPPSFGWPNSPSLSNGFCSPQSQLQFHGLPRSSSHMLNSMNSHHVGSAPAVDPSFWDRGNSYPGGSPEASNLYQGPLGNMRLSGSPLNHMDFVSHNVFPHAGLNSLDLVSSRNVCPQGHHQRGMIYQSRGQMNMVGSFEHPGERVRSHRSENSSTQANRKQYELDIGRIKGGEDNRTTLMIKNIPNKYTSKMLMAAIDERHRGTYDFIYLPIDFKNKCNVGYAFINMIDPKHVIPLYETLNGNKWEKFNSEKVASLAYARIQGKAALVSHFQNSSLMNEDKRCRPILFHSDGTSAGDQVPFPMGLNIRSKPGRSRTSNDEDDHQDSPPNLGS